MGETSDSEHMAFEEDCQSHTEMMNFAVVTLQDTDEVMVVASDWLSTDKKQCYWPPFKSPEKYMEAVKNSLDPEAGEKQWETLNVLFHEEHDTYEAAVNNQEEQKALKDGRILYTVVTLQNSNELTVIPATWMNEEKTQCYWPPFTSPESCIEAIQYRFKPNEATVQNTVEKTWKMLNIQVHMECATYKQAMKKQKLLKESRKRNDFLPTNRPTTSTLPQRYPRAIKRKCPHETLTVVQPLVNTDKEIMLKAKQIMIQVTDNLASKPIMHEYIISKINKMNNVSRKKATIGVFGKSGEGKSSLLNAILGKQYLLPSGCFGACTAVVTQVEANLTDSNYTADIEFFSKEEWENELTDLFNALSAEDEDRDEELIETAEEKITALYGADAHKKTLEELKNDDIFAEIEILLSNRKKTILIRDVTQFAYNVGSYISNSAASSGDWYWPIVKSVSIKVPDCHELMENIVLVDIPGSGDCSTIRDDKWKSKLSECSSVWIVSDINRAITDKDPWGILKHCIEVLEPGGECKNINFICTKTDDIVPEDYMRLSRLTDKFSGDKDMEKKCRNHRNENAKTRVKEKFEYSNIKKTFITNGDFLKVFTVSSKAFFHHNLNLEPSETEIPKLQDDLRSLNKSITRELTQDYVNEAKGVLYFIQNVQSAKNKKTNEMKVKVHMEFEENLKNALNDLKKHFDAIYNNLELHLSKGVEESVQKCVASTKAMIAPEVDIREFEKILQALCNSGGCYWSKNRNAVLDLNRDLAKHMYKCIDEYFLQIFPVTGKTGKSVQEQIDKFSLIQSDSAYNRSPIFLHIQNFIKIEEDKLKASLNRDIVDKKEKIYLSITQTIRNEMDFCYEQAADLTGPASMKMKQDLLISTVDKIKHDMFNKAKMQMLKKLQNLLEDTKINLESELMKTMSLLLSQTTNTKSMDVSREIEEMEKLSELLSD